HHRATLVRASRRAQKLAHAIVVTQYAVHGAADRITAQNIGDNTIAAGQTQAGAKDAVRAGQRTGRAGSALRPGRASSACGTGAPRDTLRALRTSFAARTLRTGFAARAGRTGCARAIRTRSAVGAVRAVG